MNDRWNGLRWLWDGGGGEGSLYCKGRGGNDEQANELFHMLPSGADP